eukprot:gene1193-15557_t
MTASKDRGGRQMSPDVDKYFNMLKEQFSFDGLRRSSSAGSSKEHRSIVFRSRFDSLSNDISHKYHRHSMVEGGSLYVAKQRSLDSTLSKSARGLHIQSDHMAHQGRLSTSLTTGEFRDLINNNDLGSEDLQSRHMEMALNQGKLNSVSEQNRKKRRKVFEKERKYSK